MQPADLDLAQVKMNTESEVPSGGRCTESTSCVAGSDEDGSSASFGVSHEAPEPVFDSEWSLQVRPT